MDAFSLKNKTILLQGLFRDREKLFCRMQQKWSKSDPCREKPGRTDENSLPAEP
jgi:hypothetical protein